MSTVTERRRTPAGGRRQRPSWWALAIGIAVAAIPLLHFRAGGHATGGRHMDHSPHHGGQLGMVGDVHVELVEIGDMIAIHLSDAERRPLPPTHGTVTFDTGTSRPLAPSAGFLSAPIDKRAQEVTVEVAADGIADDPIEISFLLGR